MEEIFSKRFGLGPFPFPVDRVKEYIEYYDSNGINICSSKTESIFTINDGTHSHNSYEFIIPSNPMPYTNVDNKCIFVNTGNILFINPDQIHGAMGEMHVKHLIGGHIDKDFLLDTAFQLFNVDNFTFRNEPLIPNTEIKQIMQQFIQEARAHQSGHKFILECLSTQLVINLLRLEENHICVGEYSYNAEISRNINKVIEFLRANYASNDYSSKEIADIANLSRYHFIRVFKNETGKTPYEYLIDIKIEKAIELLKDRNYSITEICNLCGFTSHSHFSTIFKKHLGLSPSEYRKSLL